MFLDEHKLTKIQQDINYFTDKGSNNCICLVNACKAFDRTNHFALFACILRKGIPKPITNNFISWYRILPCQFCWAEDVSYSFPIPSSLPQGSLLSPKFYKLVTNVVLHVLQDSGSGCYIINSLQAA